MKQHANAIKEARNAALLEVILIDAGYTPARPAFDAGIDLLAYKKGETLALQLKSRACIGRKYLGQGVHIVWQEPSDKRWYMIEHDELVRLAETSTGIASTISWKDRGLYHWPKAPNWLLQGCEVLGTH